MQPQLQMQIPLENLKFAFKFREEAPFRYFNSDIREFSEPGYIAQIIDIMSPDEVWEKLQEIGYTELLDGTVDILVLDRYRCLISDAGNMLRKLAVSMN